MIRISLQYLEANAASKVYLTLTSARTGDPAKVRRVEIQRAVREVSMVKYIDERRL